VTLAEYQTRNLGRCLRRISTMKFATADINIFDVTGITAAFRQNAEDSNL
jgi:hypothetical protein